jgi:signal transduction histidine kinase
MRRQLALVSLAVTSLVVVAFTLPLALLYRRQAEDRAIVAAERRAQAVAADVAVAAGPELDRAAIDEVVLSSDGIGELSVILPNDDVIGAPVPVTAAVARAREGFAFRADTGEVVVPVVTREGTAVVRVGLLSGDLTEGVGRAWLVLGLLGLGMIALAVVVADRLGRSFVRPVGELAVTAERLGSGELEARVRPAGPPEVVEVGVALNELAGRVEVLLAAERESVADLSHRLRTPLTALRLRAEAVDDPEAAAALLAQVDRLQREVDDLIHSARRGSRSTSGVDLGLVARNRSDFWLVLADEQGRSFRIDLPTSPVIVEADVSEVAAVIDALVGNGGPLGGRRRTRFPRPSCGPTGREQGRFYRPRFGYRKPIRRAKWREPCCRQFSARRGEGRGASSQPVAFDVSQRDRIASISCGVKR